MTPTPPLHGARFDDATGVWRLGEPVAYADGSEVELEVVMAGTSDRSSTSDELAGAIHDWPTRYHLSRLRGNLLAPLTVEPGTRVLDVGAGTGALARHLGERGAEVVALEGASDRAQVAARRCADLDGVSVVVGRAEDVGDERFDLVLLVGVLEYAGAEVGGGGGAPALLGEVRRLLAPGGVAVVAIENQLGLKYLLGYPEDHVGEPWVGLEGYSGGHDVRTWSRAGLSALLDDAGLGARRWLFPFPDYKLPTVTLAEAAYEHADSGRLIDQLVRKPVHDWTSPRPALRDERRVHRTFVEAALGPEVANSFVVVAGAQAAVLDRVLPEDPLAWVFGGERKREFMRARRLVPGSDGLRVEPLIPGETTVAGWLTQTPEVPRPYVEGLTLEQLVLEAVASDDLGGTAAALRQWLGAQAEPETWKGGAEHPFLTETTERTLPGDHLDVELANFVSVADGVECIDREWHAAVGVDADVVQARALWYLAYTIVHTQARHPFGPDVSVDEVAGKLGRLIDLEVSDEALERWKTAEVELQHLVLGFDRAFLAAQYRHDGAATTETVTWAVEGQPGPVREPEERPESLARRAARRIRRVLGRG